MGRPKKLDIVKERQGTLRPSRVNNTAPAANDNIIHTPPDTLDKEAHHIWYAQSEALRQMGILSFGDQVLLEAYCRYKLQYDRITQQLESEDFIIQTNDGKTDAINPLIKLQSQIFEHLLKLSQRFGFDPLSRSSINTTPRLPNDPLGDEL